MSWPPTSHTVNEMFLYSTVSTLKPAGDRGQSGGVAVSHRHPCDRDVASKRVKLGRGKFGRRISSASLDAADGSSCGGSLPMVGMVVTISPSLSLYRMVVLPAASRPTWVDERKRRTGFQRSHARERIPNFCRPPLESGRKTPPARTIRMRISFLEKSLLKSLVNVSPMVENSRVGARARRR